MELRKSKNFYFVINDNKLMRYNGIAYFNGLERLIKNISDEPDADIFNHIYEQEEVELIEVFYNAREIKLKYSEYII